MTKVYVIMEIGYEYNDEYHSKSENNDGQPYKTVYTNETEARAKLKELTVDWLKYDYLASGFNRYGDGHSYGEFLEALRENGVITKKELTSSLAIWNKENSQSYDAFYQYSDDFSSFLASLHKQSLIFKKDLKKAINNYETEMDYGKPSKFICDLLDKLVDVNLAFQLDILLNELEKYYIIPYSLVTLELA